MAQGTNELKLSAIAGADIFEPPLNIGSLYYSAGDGLLHLKTNGPVDQIITLNDSIGTLSDKSLDAPIILNYFNIAEQGSGLIPNPSADTANIYLNSGDGLLHIRRNGPVEDIFTLNDEPQTVSNKIFVNATISSLSSALAIAQGGTGATTASGARTNLGLGSLALQDGNNVAITAGIISGVNFSANLVQNFLGFVSAGPASSIPNYLTLFKDGSTDIFKYNTPSGTVRELVNTNSAQPLSNKTISSSTISSSTISSLSSALSIANGGTGATTASGARTNLGLGNLSLQDGNNVAITGGNASNLNLSSAIFDGFILGDFSALSSSGDRVLFKTTNPSSFTFVGAVPTLAGGGAGFFSYRETSIANSAYTGFSAESTSNKLITGANGTGTILPLDVVYGATTLLSFISTSTIQVANGKRISAAQTAGNSFVLGTYDGAAYKDFITFTSNSAPSCAIAAPSGGELTIDGATRLNMSAQAAPSTPASGTTLFAPSSGTTTIVNYKDSAGATHQIIDAQTPQSMSDKTIFSLTASGYLDYVWSKTSSTTLGSTQGYINNTGATGSITQTMPASPVNGQKVVVRITAAQTVIMQPNTGQTMANSSASTVSDLRSNTINSMLSFRFDNGVWATEAMTGTWT